MKNIILKTNLVKDMQPRRQIVFIQIRTQSGEARVANQTPE